MCCHHGNALLHHRLLDQHLPRHRFVALLHKHSSVPQVHVHGAAEPLRLRVELRLPELDLVANVALGAHLQKRRRRKRLLEQIQPRGKQISSNRFPQTI